MKMRLFSHTNEASLPQMTQVTSQSHLYKNVLGKTDIFFPENSYTCNIFHLVVLLILESTD